MNIYHPPIILLFCNKTILPPASKHQYTHTYLPQSNPKKKPTPYFLFIRQRNLPLSKCSTNTPIKKEKPSHPNPRAWPPPPLKCVHLHLCVVDRALPSPPCTSHQRNSTVSGFYLADLCIERTVFFFAVSVSRGVGASPYIAATRLV